MMTREMMKRMLLFAVIVIVSAAMAFPQADGSISVLGSHSASAPPPAAVNSALLYQYCDAGHAR